MSRERPAYELQKARRKRERQVLIASLPIRRQDLSDLFDVLDGDNFDECDTTLRVTTAFLRERGLDVERIVSWLHKHGGYCDCEVLLNVERAFPDIRGSR